MAAGKVEEHSHRQEEYQGWQMGITTYRVGKTWFCTVDNVSPGARLYSASGESRESVEKQAVRGAQLLLSKTRRVGSG